MAHGLRITPRFTKVPVGLPAASTIDRGKLDRGCLLCSELSPERCHRRLLAEHLQRRIEGLVVKHL